MPCKNSCKIKEEKKCTPCANCSSKEKSGTCSKKNDCCKDSCCK